MDGGSHLGRRLQNHQLSYIAKLAIEVILKTVAATDAKNRLGALLAEAQREPIVIRRQDRDIAVVLSMADYERLRAGNVQAFLDLRKDVAAQAATRALLTSASRSG
jgi:prevent-host-death family protein